LKVKTGAVAALCGCFAVSAAAQAPQAPPSTSSDFVRVEIVEGLPPAVDAAADALKAPALFAHVAFLASPALGGRGLGTPGLDAAAEYAAVQLALAGVPSLREGTYFQPVPLREITGGMATLDVVKGRDEDADRRTFLSGVDCLIPQIPARTLAAGVVFAGWGIRETSPARDDWRGLDVKGKAVLLLGGAPDAPEWKAKKPAARWASEDMDERYRAKLEIARSLGAAAVLAVEDHWATAILPKHHPDEKTFWRLEDDGLDDEKLLFARVSPSVAAELLGGPAFPVPPAPRALPGARISITTRGTERTFLSRNVVGRLAGSDPKVADEAVVIGAHLDHLGVVDGAIHPGADDNASGVAALIEIAKAAASAKVRPRRSLVFVFWTGEEEGKFGSAHWVRHPLWPLAKTAAYVNLDMIAHAWTEKEMRDLAAELPDGGRSFLAGLTPMNFTEVGVADFAPGLGEVLARAARGTGTSVHLDRTPGVHGGSDYRDFARAGVPFLRFFGNFFDGYHTPRDTPASVSSFSNEIRKNARLALVSAWLLADR
jgi:hypothetical protein